MDAVTVHVLTPCSRRANLPAVVESVKTAAERVPEMLVTFHVLFDDQREHVGGWGLRNQMLDDFDDGWLWMLDDDTLAHPELFARFADALAWQPELLMFLVAQTRPEGWDPGCANPDKLGHGSRLHAGGCAFDTGQVIVRRDVIGDYRFADDRAADGLLWEDVLAKVPRDHTVWTDDVLAFYNALRS